MKHILPDFLCLFSFALEGWILHHRIYRHFLGTEGSINLFQFVKRKTVVLLVRTGIRTCDSLNYYTLLTKKRAPIHCANRLWHRWGRKIDYQCIPVLTARTMVSGRNERSAHNVTFVLNVFLEKFILRPFIEKDLAHLDTNVKFQGLLWSM